LVIRRSTLAAGPFQLRQTLRSGRLIGHATLRPGGFVVVLRGHAGRVRLPLEVRTLSVGAPPEGVVGKAYASMTRGGRAGKRVPAGAKEAWAVFQFAAQPRGLPITARWYQPNGQLLGSIDETNRPTIQTGITARSRKVFGTSISSPVASSFAGSRSRSPEPHASL